MTRILLYKNIYLTTLFLERVEVGGWERERARKRGESKVLDRVPLRDTAPPPIGRSPALSGLLDYLTIYPRLTVCDVGTCVYIISQRLWVFRLSTHFTRFRLSTHVNCSHPRINGFLFVQLEHDGSIKVNMQHYHHQKEAF